MHIGSKTDYKVNKIILKRGQLDAQYLMDVFITYNLELVLSIIVGFGYPLLM